MATDQEIRDAGFKFIPQQKYLLNPFEIPTPPTVNQPPPGQTGIFATDAGDNFSVYNMDPNRIVNMNPNRYALQDARYDNELSYVDSPITGYTTDTEAMKHMAMYPEYYGLDKPPPSKISQLIRKGIGVIPGVGTLSRIANFASGLLPVNRRAIMENQLGAGGVMVDDIGRIVVGPGGSYNTPEGIMAGYNVAKMTDKTFTDRISDVSETLADKYGLTTDQISGIISGELDEDDFTGSQYSLPSGKTTNLITNLRNLEIARKNFDNVTNTTDEIFDLKTDTRRKKGDDDKPTGGGKKYTGGGGSGVPDQIGGNQNVGGGASYSKSAETGAKDGFGYGLKYGGLASIL